MDITQAYRDRFTQFIGDSVPTIDHKELTEAIHGMSEMAIWPDFVSTVSEEQVILCWRLVERLRETKVFPADLKL